MAAVGVKKFRPDLKYATYDLGGRFYDGKANHCFILAFLNALAAELSVWSEDISAIGDPKVASRAARSLGISVEDGYDVSDAIVNNTDDHPLFKLLRWSDFLGHSDEAEIVVELHVIDRNFDHCYKFCPNLAYLTGNAMVVPVVIELRGFHFKACKHDDDLIQKLYDLQ